MWKISQRFQRGACQIAGRYLNIGNAGFQSVRKGLYVDKSGMISLKSIWCSLSGYYLVYFDCGQRLLLVGIHYNKDSKRHECVILTHLRDEEAAANRRKQNSHKMQQLRKMPRK